MMARAVVKSTEWPPLQAAWPSAMPICVLPRPTVEIKTTLVLEVMKARRNRFWICGRLIFFGHVHSKSSIVLRTGKRAFLMRRAMARFSRSVASPSINSARYSRSESCFWAALVAKAWEWLFTWERCRASSSASKRLRSLGVTASSVIDSEVGRGDVDIEEIDAAGELQRAGLGEGAGARLQDVGDVLGAE